MSIHTIFEEISKDNNNTALVYEEKTLTYQELNNKSNQLARKLNCKSEEVVGILLYPSLETVISILAVLKSGGAYVPILPSFPKDRINYMINDTKLTKMIIASDYNNSDLEVIDLRTFNYDEFNSCNLNLDIKETNLAYIIYTSGSTGQPKGVMIEHKNVINTCKDHQPVYTIENKKTCKSILFSSFTWDVSVCEIFTNLFNGNTLYVLSENIKKNIKELYDYINKNNIEICYFPPALLGIIPYDEESCCIKKIIFAGEKCDNKIGLIWAKRVKLYNYYGPAEGTIYVTGKQVNTENVNEIGKPIKNINIYIVDLNMKLVNNGEKGELLFSGLGVARGYLNLPEETKKSFIKNPFGEGIIYKTGDIVRMNKNGDLEYVGRVDNQVNIRGKRVELNEVNEAILSCEFVDNSVVKCKTNEDNINEFIFCNYTVKENKISITKELQITYNNKLTDFLKEKLPDYMIPQYFILLDKFELNASGKIDQDKLKEPTIVTVNEYTGDLLNNEKYVVVNRIINKINNTDISYKPDDNLNQIGIDSLKMIQLISELNKNKYTIDVDLILKCKTINDIINYLNISDNGSNNAEKLFKYYRNKISNSELENGEMNIDANDYQVTDYFSSNFYINNENTDNLNYDNDLSKLKNQHEITYKIGYNGACQSSIISNILELFFVNDFIKIENSALGSHSGQGNILNLVQDINKNNLDKLKKDSHNVLNEFSFPSLDKLDIIVLTGDSINVYYKYIHIDTGIEFITREYELIKNNADFSKFKRCDKLTSEELRTCIDKLILKYPSKKFIFINCLYDNLIERKKLRKAYNEVYDSFKNKKNIHILDVNKYTNYDSRYTSWWAIPIIDIIKITNELNNIIDKVIKNDNNNLKISKFFKDNYIYHNDNFKLKYLNENNNYLTSVILMNENFNDKIKSMGLSWYLNIKFIRTHNKKFKTSKLSCTKFETLYSNIPILNCKLIFHARTDKYYKELRFKIYTGSKWEIIEKEITTEYQKFELDSEFNYKKTSKPRIGFLNVEPNMVIFINNPYFDL
jgi:amino acid adenylation domain-containing protein